jgi:hypothetical protein
MQQQAEHTAYRVKQGYRIYLPFQQVILAGEVLENPSPELVRLNAWKLEPVKPACVAPETQAPLPAFSLIPGGDISIIIPAWGAADFLQECLDSLIAQTHLLSGDNQYEILLGVDACNSTRKRALKIASNYPNLKVYYFERNYGPYIVKNSLARITEHKRLMFFDADDTASPDMIERLLLCDQEPVGAAVYMNGCDSDGYVKKTCGVFLIRKTDFIGLGGFMPWQCAADTEFLQRLGISRTRKIFLDETLMHRRVHDKQLTIKPDTGFGSTLRAGYMRQIRQLGRLGFANAGMVTAESERIN